MAMLGAPNAVVAGELPVRRRAVRAEEVCLGRAGRQNHQVLNSGVRLVEGGFDVGQCGEDCILVDMNSRPYSGDANSGVSEVIEASVSAGTVTVLLGCAFL